ncbi:urea carboxylase-associated family protein [Oleomonas cavernae]|uniref:Urea carboxylase-associated family protein n=1 Tax=Oleomonas cavernae TaxID=2320859 RepID=A0A418W9K2_9PROT|nr:urea carboxylase-associated family protein [Oleomonas cavernae]RJF86646.1 urea carboxylase-associated family protein [Oleomonas cavernae]
MIEGVVPARQGVAVRVGKGQSLKLINTHGSQVVDFWAFSADDPREFLSMEHLHTRLLRLIPRPGDPLVTNKRRPILTFVEDTTPGIHDTVIAACDLQRYMELGCTTYHENCTDNLGIAMRRLGLAAPECPAPFNVFMNVPVSGPDLNVAFVAPTSRPGDHVVFRAEMDCIAVMSACPMDITPVNGDGLAPTEVHYAVF